MLVSSATLAVSSAAFAATTFSYTGKIVEWTTPTTGLYAVELWGGKGGGSAGGLGAEVGGDVELTAGEVVEVVVAGDGGFACGCGAGGGGASWLYSGNSLIAVAGGGGGQDWTGQFPGSAGTAYLDASGHVSGGSGVGGGAYGGGAGWLGNSPTGSLQLSDCVRTCIVATGGYGRPTFQGGKTIGSYAASDNRLPVDGVSGGFGGGGGGGYSVGGGGAGFSGGAGGTRGGGTSYLTPSATNVNALTGVSSAGRIEISLLEAGSAPEPATWVEILTGAAAAGAIARRRRRGRAR
jgi:hypothetical protein